MKPAYVSGYLLSEKQEEYSPWNSTEQPETDREHNGNNRYMPVFQKWFRCPDTWKPWKKAVPERLLQLLSEKNQKQCMCAHYSAMH